MSEGRAIREQKAALRREQATRLKALAPEELRQGSLDGGRHLLSLLEHLVPAGLPLAVFASTPEELSIDPVVELLAARHPLLWPRVDGEALTFHRCRADELVAHPRPWLREPPADAPEEIPGALVVPGRAFDRLGVRLGRGAGFYDRTFSALSENLRIGYCFTFQLVERLPVEPHDCRMEWVVTESGPVRCVIEGARTDGDPT